MKHLCIIVLVVLIFSGKCRGRVSHHLHGLVNRLGDQNSSSVAIVLDEDVLKVNDVVYKKFYKLLSNTTVPITVDNRLLNPEKFFYYIQVHSYLQEVIISWTENSKSNNYHKGTNLGQIFFSTQTDKNQTLFLTNPNSKSVSLMIALLVYDIKNTPIPGSCSTTGFQPSLNTTTNWDTISTFIKPAKGLTGDECASVNSSVSYEIRFIYFGKNEYSPDVYFDTLSKFLVAGKALDYGEPFEGKIDPHQEHRRLFCRYAGMGLFFVAILRDTSNDSHIPISYVPSVSYGCPGTVVFDEIHCDLIENSAAKMIYVLIMLVGIGIMIFGRGLLFIRATVYSFMIAGFVLYTVHSVVPFGGVAKLTIAIGLGVVLVGTWIRTLLQCHAIYRLTDFMAAIILGYTFSCLILFGSADAGFMVSSVNYYLVLSAGVLLITLWYFSLLAVCGVIIMNIMVGCTFIVLTLLFIFDGNLQYAFVNNWRRIRDDDFRYALSFPHLEVVDWISICLWWVIFGFGLCFQRKCECAGDAHRPRSPRIFRDPEQQPLIAGVIGSGDSNDVFLSPRSNSLFLSSISERSHVK